MISGLAYGGSHRNSPMPGTIGQTDQSPAKLRPGSTAADTTAGLSQSVTLAPTHNASVIPADKRRDSVAFRNTVQSYHSTGVLAKMVVQAHYSTLALLRMILVINSTGVLAYKRTIRLAYVTDKRRLWYKRTMPLAAYYGSVIVAYAPRGLMQTILNSNKNGNHYQSY